MGSWPTAQTLRRTAQPWRIHSAQVLTLAKPIHKVKVVGAPETMGVRSLANRAHRDSYVSLNANVLIYYIISYVIPHHSLVGKVLLAPFYR